VITELTSLYPEITAMPCSGDIGTAFGRKTLSTILEDIVSFTVHGAGERAS
jgi:hypothetical protein